MSLTGIHERIDVARLPAEAAARETDGAPAQAWRREMERAQMESWLSHRAIPVAAEATARSHAEVATHVLASAPVVLARDTSAVAIQRLVHQGAVDPIASGHPLAHAETRASDMPLGVRAVADESAQATGAANTTNDPSAADASLGAVLQRHLGAVQLQSRVADVDRTQRSAAVSNGFGASREPAGMLPDDIATSARAVAGGALVARAAAVETPAQTRWRVDATAAQPVRAGPVLAPPAPLPVLMNPVLLVPGSAGTSSTSFDANAAERAEDASAAARPALSPMKPAAAEPASARVHAEWSADGLRLWLGLDAHLLGQVQPLVSQLHKWLAGMGLRLLSVTCNGTNVDETFDPVSGLQARDAPSREPIPDFQPQEPA